MVVTINCTGALKIKSCNKQNVNEFKKMKLLANSVIFLGKISSATILNMFFEEFQIVCRDFHDGILSDLFLLEKH